MSYFVRFDIKRKKRSDTLLVPVESAEDIKSLQIHLKKCGWSVETNTSPFDTKLGKEINASRLRGVRRIKNKLGCYFRSKRTR